MAKPAEPRRLRWSVPQADVSTNRWLDEQENISRSLQVLIRESIQRDGYIDVVNRPVEQLPRRGRPPLVETSSDPSPVPAAATPERSDAQSIAETDVQKDPAPSAENASEESEETAIDASESEDSAAQAPVAEESAKPASENAADEQSPSSANQLDVDDIFGHGG